MHIVGRRDDGGDAVAGRAGGGVGAEEVAKLEGIRVSGALEEKEGKEDGEHGKGIHSPTGGK